MLSVCTAPVRLRMRECVSARVFWLHQTWCANKRTIVERIVRPEWIDRTTDDLPH
jgi:hypothetical protein